MVPCVADEKYRSDMSVGTGKVSTPIPALALEYLHNEHARSVKATTNPINQRHDQTRKARQRHVKLRDANTAFKA